MKICDIIAEALPGVAPVVKGIAKAIAPSEKTLAKRAAKAAPDIDYEVAKSVIRSEWAQVSKKLGALVTALTWAGIATPFWHYWWAVRLAETKLKAGVYTQENYDYVRQTEMSKLVTAVTVGLAGKAVFGTFHATMSVFKRIPIFGTALRPVLDFLQTLDKTAQVAFVAFLNTATGRRWLALAATADFFEGTPYEIDVAQIVGGSSAALLDMAKEAVGLKSSTPAAPSTKSRASVPASASTAADTSSAPVTTNTPSNAPLVMPMAGVAKDPFTGRPLN